MAKTDPTKCDKCGESYTKKDMDGGRCLSCGTMIVSTDEELHRKELGIKEFEEPDYCANCGSDQPMNFHKLSINGKDGVPGYVCEECGHAHYEKEPGPKYSGKLDSEEQVNAEEVIASTIFDFDYQFTNERPPEADCAVLAREILKKVLMQFRPDLFEIKGS